MFRPVAKTGPAVTGVIKDLPALLPGMLIQLLYLAAVDDQAERHCLLLQPVIQRIPQGIPVLAEASSKVAVRSKGLQQASFISNRWQ